MINLTVEIKVEKALTRLWRWLKQRYILWRYGSQIEAHFEALRAAQVAIMQRYSADRVVEDWPLAEARFSYDAGGGKPRACRNGSGTRLIVTFHRWDSDEPAEIAWAVARKVVYNKPLRDELRDSEFAQESIAWSMLRLMAGCNEELARAVAPKLQIEFERSIAQETRLFAERLLVMFTAATGTERLQPSFAVALQHALQLAVRQGIASRATPPARRKRRRTRKDKKQRRP